MCQQNVKKNSAQTRFTSATWSIVIQLCSVIIISMEFLDGCPVQCTETKNSWLSEFIARNGGINQIEDACTKKYVFISTNNAFSVFQSHGQSFKLLIIILRLPDGRNTANGYNKRIFSAIMPNRNNSFFSNLPFAIDCICGFSVLARDATKCFRNIQ